MLHLSRRALLQAAATPFVNPRPNLLFILTDGWRAQSLPSAGDPNLLASNLARLAREGADCRRAYTSYPVCCPSRAAILTGKSPRAAGVVRNHSLLPLDQPTMSAALQRAGYRTGYIGKWHLDGHDNPGFVPRDRRRGFDYWAACNVDHRHYDFTYFRDDPTPIVAPGFAPDHQTDLAIDFLRQPGPAPFYLYLSFVAPHAPLTPPALHATYDPSALRLRSNVPPPAAAKTRQDLAGYYGLCSAVDGNVGRLLKELDDRSLARDTVVVFSSDHGETLGSHGLDEIDQPYEEATRIPLLIRYPRRIRPGAIDALISNVDYAPTLLSLCGVQPPAAMQGRNLTPLLTRRAGRSQPAVYAEGAVEQSNQWRMVVSGNIKLVADANLRPTQLYDLTRDPYEQENLVTSPSHRRTRDGLQALLQSRSD
jgi:arylsulfatase A-like enzyme